MVRQKENLKYNGISLHEMKIILCFVYYDKKKTILGTKNPNCYCFVMETTPHSHIPLITLI